MRSTNKTRSNRPPRSRRQRDSVHGGSSSSGDDYAKDSASSPRGSIMSPAEQVAQQHVAARHPPFIPPAVAPGIPDFLRSQYTPSASQLPLDSGLGSRHQDRNVRGPTSSLAFSGGGRSGECVKLPRGLHLLHS